MFFLTPDELHKQQRPYTFKFPPYNGCPQSNMTHEQRHGIPIENMRGREDQFQLERNGFTILKVDTGLDYDEFFEEKKVKQYLSQMEGVLKAHLGASRVEVFRHGVHFVPVRRYIQSLTSAFRYGNGISPIPYQMELRMSMTSQPRWLM
jgi:hypothetical protein